MTDEVKNETKQLEETEKLGEGKNETSGLPPCHSLLVVVGEPLNAEQKDLVLERVASELSFWDSELSGCNVISQLQSLMSSKSSEINAGEKILECHTAEFHATVMINPLLETLFGKMTSFLSIPHKYKFLLHAGPVLASSGSWILQDGVFTFHNFVELCKNPEVVESLVKPPESLVDVCVLGGSSDWTEASFNKACPKLKVRLSRKTKSVADDSGLVKFSDFISNFFKTLPIGERLKSPESVKGICFERPSCYIFPAGQGTSVLFGVSGFNILLDGGFNQNTCFYNILRNFDHLDVVLISRLSPDNIFGLSSFFEKQALEKQPPHIGAVLWNIGDLRHKPVPLPSESLTSENPRSTLGLVVNIAEEVKLVGEHLSLLNLIPPLPCLGPQPINLFFNVGLGSLDMYVLNPNQDTKELKDFLQTWSKLVDSYKGGLPISDNFSVACLLLWKPAAHLKDNVVRLLYPGRIGAQKLQDGLDKLKNSVYFQTKNGQVKKVISATKQPISRGGRSDASTRKAENSNKTPSVVSIDKKEDKKNGDISKKPSSTSFTAKKITKSSPLKSTSTAPKTKPPQSTDTKITKSKTDKKPDTLPHKFSSKSSKTHGDAKKSPQKETPKFSNLESPELHKSEGATSSNSNSPEQEKSGHKTEGQDQIEMKKEEKSENKEKVNEEEKEDSEIKDLPSKIEGFDPTKQWEAPQALPSPTKIGEETSKSPDKNFKKPSSSNTKRPEKSGKEELNKSLSGFRKTKPSVDGKTSSGTKSEVKKTSAKPVVPFYVDLTYIPNQVDLDFFRRVRATYYVLSSSNPDPSVLHLLIEGKTSWDDPENPEVTLIPTHQTRVLLNWLENENQNLESANIKISPPASRCAIQLEDGASSCEAYRIQF